VLVATDALSELAGQTATDLGLPDLRVVSVAHPIGGVDPDEVRRRADGAVDEVLGLLTGSRLAEGSIR